MAELIPPAIITILGNAPVLDTIADVKAALADLAKQTATPTIDGDGSPLATSVATAKASLDDLAKETVTATIDANDSELITKLAQARLALLALAKTATTIDPKLDMSQVIGQIAELKSLLSDKNLDVDLDIKPALLEMAQLKGELALTKLDDLMVHLNTRGAIEEATYMQQYIDAMVADITVGAEINNTELDATLASIDATIALATKNIDIGVNPVDAAAKASIGKVIGSAMGGAFWGGDAANGFVSRLLSPLTALSHIFSASFLSLGSMAGFGTEHLAITGASTLGTGAAGLLGGGSLLAATSLSIALTGIATDMAGIGQASGDIKTVNGAMTNLATTVKTYGKNSKEAAVAASQLAQAESGFSPAARGAVIAVAKQLQALPAIWDKYTGMAEKYGAEIIGQTVSIGTSFIPIIGKYATENMKTIQKDIQPFFKWLQTAGPNGGVGVLNTLEKAFQGNLPKTITALTKGFELFGRTVALLAPQSGKLIGEIAKKLTEMNTPTGFAKWEKEVEHLVSEFHTWVGFLKSIYDTVRDIFGNSADLGIDIIKTLTGDLNHLDGAVNSIQGKDALKNLFGAHKQEFMTLIQTLISIGGTITKVYIVAAPALTKIATFFLQLTNAAIKFVSKLPGGADLIGIGLIAAKLGLLSPVFKAIGKEVDALATKFVQWGAKALLSMAKTAAGAVISAAQTTAAWVASAAESTALWAMYAVQSIGKFVMTAARAVASAVATAAANVAAAATTAAAWLVANAAMIGIWVALIAAVVVAILEIKAHWRGIVTFFKNLWGDIEKAAVAVWNYVKDHWKTIIIAVVAVVTGPIGALVLFLATHWKQVLADVKSTWNTVLSFLKRVGKDILAVFTGAGTWLYDVGKQIIQGLVNGIKNMAGKAVQEVKNVGHDVVSGAKSILHIFSPSTDFIEIGEYVVKGLAQGISSSSEASNVQSMLLTLANKMLTTFKSMLPQWTTIGEQMMQGLAKGIENGTAGVAAAATSAANASTSATKTATKTSSPSQVFAEIGMNLMQGLAQGITAHKGLATGAATSVFAGVGSTVPRAGASAGLSSGLTIGTIKVEVTVQGGSGADIKKSLTTDVPKQMAEQMLTALRAGAGTSTG